MDMSPQAQARRLQFARWLVEQGRLSDDTPARLPCPDCGGSGVIGDGYPCCRCVSTVAAQTTEEVA